jgi:hypothetical protein
MLGRLPWLALERRIRALRFLVFFDMGGNPSVAFVTILKAADQARRPA